jgi:hypothetical protein
MHPRYLLLTARSTIRMVDRAVNNAMPVGVTATAAPAFHA